MATERVLSNLNLISFKTEGGLQNHIDDLQDGDLAFTPDNSLKGNIFDFKWADHLLNDMSWLRADTFSWQSGDVYVAAYNHLVADFEGTIAETETIDDITIAFYRAEDGHKICMPDQESNISALYETTGVAWYYLLDTANKQFKLPRTKHAFTGLRDSVGGYVEAGLPNITGSVGYTIGSNATATGAFTKDANSNSAWWSGATAVARSSTFHLDASNSSSIYGKGNTVQPPATQMYLYFYVGCFEKEGLEQTAGITAETFNSKADADLRNIPTNYDYVVESQLPTEENGYTWYRKYKSGWVEQGSSNPTNAVNITFPIEMLDANYTATCMGGGHTGSGADVGIYITSKTNTGFTFQPDRTTNVNWQVSGVSAQ